MLLAEMLTEEERRILLERVGRIEESCTAQVRDREEARDRANKRYRDIWQEAKRRGEH